MPFYNLELELILYIFKHQAEILLRAFDLGSLHNHDILTKQPRKLVLISIKNRV